MLRTIAVGRHVLLLAEVAAGSVDRAGGPALAASTGPARCGSSRCAAPAARRGLVSGAGVPVIRAADRLVVLATGPGCPAYCARRGNCTPAYNISGLKMGLPKIAPPELRSGQIFHLVLMGRV